MLNVVIFAAGLGTRMNSDTPKVLHTIAGSPLLAILIDAILPLNPDQIFITYSQQKEQVKTVINQLFPKIAIYWVEQKQILGTADAMRCIMNSVNNNANDDYLVLCGDMPFIQDENSCQIITTRVLVELIEQHKQNDITILTNHKVNPYGYGRIIRDVDNNICAIIEQKNLSQHQNNIKEINTGIYLFKQCLLKRYLDQIQVNQLSKEYYLTDIVALIYNDNIKIDSLFTPDHCFFAAVNNQLQLTEIERKYQLFLVSQLLTQGVRLFDINRIDIRGQLIVGKNCEIDVNCVFSGRVILGNNVTIGIGCSLTNVTIGNHVDIKPYTVIEGAEIGSYAQVGPFARVRPKTVLADYVKIGNFVEIKNSSLGSNSKANHLSYIGDAKIGDAVNLGAGVVVCNYDGKTKYVTTIDNHAFIGSGSMLIAPLNIGESALIAAGSVINKDAPSQELTVARAKQQTKYGWLQRKNSTAINLDSQRLKCEAPYVLLFPGQGAQFLHMMDKFKTNHLILSMFEQASTIVGCDLWQMLQDDNPDRINQTVNTQILMLTSAYALYNSWVIQYDNFIEPVYLAGHSLGEYTALVVAKVLSFTDALQLVLVRAKLMQTVSDQTQGMMSAILGLQSERVQQLCEQVNNKGLVVNCANFNTYSQTVVSGQKEAVLKVNHLVQQHGGKVVVLPVSVPAHCDLMQAIIDQFSQECNKYCFDDPKIPIVSNVTAQAESSGECLKNLLVKQLYSPVNWLGVINYISKQHVSTFIETGPNKILTRLNKKIIPQATHNCLYD